MDANPDETRPVKCRLHLNDQHLSIKPVAMEETNVGET